MAQEAATNIAGINYSGFHDSSLSIVDSDGKVLFAKSLERISRVKQDGRPPMALEYLLDKFNVSQIVTSTLETADVTKPIYSGFHPIKIKRQENVTFNHTSDFNEYFARFNKPTHFVEHQTSHAYSAIIWSGFKSGTCFTYDGGMCNSTSFGSIFKFDDYKEIQTLDSFDYRVHPKITTLYSFITGLLGFKPNKHEGKITGLAAYGTCNYNLYDELALLFSEKFLEIEQFASWEFSYSKDTNPALVVNQPKLSAYRYIKDRYSKETIAATIQAFTEDHVLDILNSAIDSELISLSEPICLAGGLFSNVKLNQRIFNLGFPDIFVAPAMTDDGTSLGAAWAHLASRSDQLITPPSNTFFGLPTDDGSFLVKEEIHLKKHEIDVPLPEFVAQKLAQNEIVAIFQGNSEFGPRALGHRSILASATDSKINQSLNEKLNRTEFMPFAPVIMEEDFELLFADRRSSSLPYMTITAEVSGKMQLESPAVVHIDNTARPQIVRKVDSGLIYEILASYKKLTGYSSLINTSFNVHEEPIVDSESDAIRGMLVAGIDWLILNGDVYSYQENIELASVILRHELFGRESKNYEKYLVQRLQEKCSILESELIQKEQVIQGLIANN